MLLFYSFGLERVLWSLLSLDWRVWGLCVLAMVDWFNSVWIFWYCVSVSCMLFVLWGSNFIQFDHLKTWVLGQSNWIELVFQRLHLAYYSYNGDHSFIWLLLDWTLWKLRWFQPFMVPSHWNSVWIYMFWYHTSSDSWINLCIQRLALIHSTSWDCSSFMHHHHLHHSSLLVQYALSHHSNYHCNHHLKLDWKDSIKIS